jgi:hypothetical protein
MFKLFKPFKPPPYSSPATRERKKVGDNELQTITHGRRVLVFADVA